LGALRAKQGRLKEAADLLRRAVRTDPSSDTARFDLARTLEQLGVRDEAAEEYRRLLQSPATSPDVRRSASERLTALTR
jgi:Flp pilus assembly protein TadD